MKLTAIFLTVACLQVNAAAFSQKISVSVNNSPLEKVFKQIKEQSGYQFLYSNELLQLAKPVSLHIKEAALDQVLEQCFKGQPLTYTVFDKTIIVKSKVIVEQAAPVDGSIKGIVTDAKNGEALSGVTVKIDGNSFSKTVVTDNSGKYQFSAVPSGSYTLKFSFIGYVQTTKQISVKSGESIENKIVLTIDVAQLEQTVIVGYGTQKKASLTTAVTSVNLKEMTNISMSNLSNALAGRASGVFVQSATGIPGQSSFVRVRSASSWNAAPPLFVIDGIVRDQTAFDALDPNQIENFSILKDAASTAIYGARASNGVLLVTTKTGKIGKPQIQLNSSFGVYSKPAIQFAYMPLLQAADITNSIYAPTVKFNDFDKQWIAQNNPDGRIYFNEAYQNPFNQKHGLTISGGSEDVTYFIGGNYYDENGFLSQLNYNKYNLRGNVSAKLNKDLTVGLNLNFNNGDRQTFVSGLANAQDLSGFYEKLFYLGSGTSPAYIDGKPVDPGWLGGNPIEVMRNGGYTKYNNQQIDALLTAEYKVPFIKGLTTKFVYSKNYSNNFTKSFAQKTPLNKFKPDSRSVAGVLTNEVIGVVESGLPTTPYVENDNGKSSSYQLNGVINYDTKIGDHAINVTAAYEQSQGYYTYSSAYKQNFPYYVTDQFAFTSQASGDGKITGYEANLPARISYIGRVNYDYAGKYLASVSVREDASSNFAKNKRWGLFPSVSAAWVLSKESFLNKSSFVDLLKLRLSYGTTGNDPSFNYLWKELYNASTTGFAVGDPVGNSSVLAYNGISNPNYTWETSQAFNAGLDFNFSRHWNLTTEFWSKKTYDILGKRILTLPVEFGTNFPPENYGKMNAKGLEVELSYKGAKLARDFEMNVSANLGLATTKVVQLDAPANTLSAEDPNGKPLNAMAGYHATGIFRSQGDINALPASYTIFGARPELGMMNFEDVSGPSGKPDGIIDTYDKVLLAKYGNAGNTASSYNSNATAGSNNAPISFGLNFNFKYKGLSLDMLWGGLAGYKILYNDPWGRSFPGLVAPAYYDNAWSANNPDGTAPKIFRSGDPRENGYKVPSTYNTYSGTFIRLKNLQLSYDLVNLFNGKKYGIKSVGVFVSATNLFILRSFKYYDPETFSSSSYPVMKTVNTGVNFQF